MRDRVKVLAIFGNVAHYGQERANIQVFSLLKEAGYDILLAVNQQGFHWHLQPEIEKRGLKYKKVNFPWNYRKTLEYKHIKSMIVNTIKCNRQIKKLIKEFQPDRIHVCNDNHVLGLMPTLYFTKIPIIYRLGDKPSAHLSSFHRFAWKHVIIPKVNQFVCISRFIRSELLKVGSKHNKIDIIYNYPPKRLLENDETLPAIDNNVLTFTFIGQISKDKGVDILVEAFLRLCAVHKNCRLLLAGGLEFNEVFVEGLKKRVAAAGMEGKIKLLGKVKTISKLFEITDINVIPSVYEEPLSNVIVEAKTYKTASIVFDSGGLPELVSHRHDGYIVKDKTIEGLLSAMIYYIENKESIEIQSINAFQSLVKLGITYEQFKTKWLSVYNG